MRAPERARATRALIVIEGQSRLLEQPEFKDAVTHSSNSILLLVNRAGHTLYIVLDRNA